MKIRFALLLGLLFFVESVSFAEAIIQRRFPPKKTAIQSSTHDLKNIEFDSNLFKPAITEIKEKISKNPTNYDLVANLVTLYLNAEEYEKAFNELIFLYNLNNQKRLSKNALNELNTALINNQKKRIYQNEKVFLYSDLAILALINDNQQIAEQYILKATDIGSAPEILIKAIQLVSINSNNNSFGIDACNSIIAKNSNSISIRKLKAELLEQNHDFLSAIKEYTMIVDLEPQDNNSKYKLYKLLETRTNNLKEIAQVIYIGRPIKTETAYYDLANILLENNELDAAKFYAEYLAKSSNNKGQGYALLSEIYRKQGNLQESYKALDEAKNNVSNSEEIKNYNIQKAKLSNNQIDEVRTLIRQKLFEQALEILNTLDKNDVDVLLMSSSANYALNNKKESFENLNKAMSLYPNNVEVYNCFASLYIREQDFDSAKKYLNEAKSIDPTNQGVISIEKTLFKTEAESYLPQITTAYEMQNYKEAERLTDEALKISNEVAELNYYKGILLNTRDKFEESTAYFYKCIELNKKHYLAYLSLAIVFDNLSERENALINYKKFIEVIPKDLYDEQEKINYAKNRIEKLEQHN